MVAIQIINPILTRISSRSDSRNLAPGALPEASLQSLNRERYPETLPDLGSGNIPGLIEWTSGNSSDFGSGNVSG